MEIKFVKANPTENKTILVESSIPRGSQASIAKAMLAADPDSEQVGFFEAPLHPKAAGRLQMMGGEFCGNASISAAAKIARDEGIKPGEEKTVVLEVSGTEGPVECVVSFDGEIYTGAVEMPLPYKAEVTDLEFNGKKYEATVVFLPGITHIIWDKNEKDLKDPAFMEKAVKAWGGLFKEEAVGLIGFDEKNCTIAPLVYVKPTDSLYWERGCGTGTAAAGVYMSYKYRKSLSIPVKQPGGVIISETFLEKDKLNKLRIIGKVSFENEGYFEI